VTHFERARRLAVAEAALRRATADGNKRDVDAYRIAVDVLRDLPLHD
jgi:hypothetical protein